MIRLIAIVMLIVAAMPHAQAAARVAADRSTRVFGNWTASCDNLGACVAIGPAEDGADLIYLRIALGAGATAVPQAKLVIAVPDDAKGPFQQFRLTAVTTTKTDTTKKSLDPLPAKAAPDDKTYVAATLPAGAPTLALIEALRDATTLEVAIAKETGTIDLKGLSAALRFIDDRQGRAGGPSALVTKGMTPAGQVPEPAQPPLVKVARAGSVTAIDKPLVTPALVALVGKACELEDGKMPEGVKAWRLQPDRVLVAVPCGMGAYNMQTALFYTDARGKPLGPVDLPRPETLAADDAGANIITNGDFDPKTMELNHFAKGRGIGDCGDLATWVWTGATFELYSAAGLEACPGAFSQDWPNLYTAAQK